MPSRTHLPEPLPGAEVSLGPEVSFVSEVSFGSEVSLGPEVSFGSGALALRVAVVPDGAPPYDCDAHGAGCLAAETVRTGGDAGRQPTVPAQGPRADAGTARPTVSAAPAPVPAPVPASGGATAPGAAASAASPVAAGATAAWPRQFAQVLVEILAGSRPARQIFPWTTDRARAQLRRLGSLVGCDRRPTIQRVVTSRPTAQVVEMTVVVNFGVRTRALAMRFEHVTGRQAAPGLPARPARWLCTEIEAG